MNDEIETQEYRNWIADLKRRYRATQVKAAVAVNSALIEYYWGLGRDISEKYSEFTKSEIYGKQFFNRLSADLKEAMPGVAGHSPQNIRYCLNFYELYAGVKIFPQIVGKSSQYIFPQVVGKSFDSVNSTEVTGRRTISSENILPQVVEKLVMIPWGHHRFIIDKCKGDSEKPGFMCAGRMNTAGVGTFCSTCSRPTSTSGRARRRHSRRNTRRNGCGR